jgi:phosphoribosylformylglycinamidine cyclo-ligase
MVALKIKRSDRGQADQISYSDAGVDIRSAEDFVKDISPLADLTARTRPGPIGGLGGFGALFDLKQTGYSDPILVSSTDGVGTKLRIAIETGRLNTIGIDLVAMCVNDVLVHGAEPLFFLNYFALGKLDRALGFSVLEGIAEGCSIAGAALVGGETAEMPSFYAAGDFDLAGFTVGAVERGQQLPRRDEIVAGDVLVGIASSGVHSNGYSLVRKLVAESGLAWSAPAPFDPNRSLGEALLTPTKIYVRSVLGTLRKHNGIKALAHITGSGALGKLHRILPSPSKNGVRALINMDSWTVPSVFKWLGDRANSTSTEKGQRELLRAFNCGIGMVAVVAKSEVNQICKSLESFGETTHVIGEIVKHSHPNAVWENPEDAVELSGKLVFQDS